MQAYLTNDTYSAKEDVAQRYDKRAGMEPLNAEFKNAWGIGKVSTTHFEGNHATLVLKLLAHNLLLRCVHQHLPKLRSWRTAWVRRVAILVPGRLVRSGRVVTMPTAPRPMLQEMLN